MTLLVQIACGLVFYYVLCYCYHRLVLHTGQHRRCYRTVVVPPHLAASNGDMDDEGHEEVITYMAIAGDLGTALVAHEIFDERVYYRHGISLDGGGGPSRSDKATHPLVVDVGTNIGLFAMSVARDYADSIVIGAEPVEELHALAVQNTSKFRERVAVVQMGAGRCYTEGLEFTLDPHITAGTSMCMDDIVKPMQQHSICSQLRAVLADNIRAGHLPYYPVMGVCRALGVPVLQLCVLTLIAPLLLLAAIYFLAGPRRKCRVIGTVGRLEEILDRASADPSITQSSAERIRTGPINLLKIDVEGAEWDVLQGMDDNLWTRVQQIVIEVHDLDDRAQQIRLFLAGKGFNHVVMDQDDWLSHELLNIKTIYAKKISPPSY